MRDTHQSLWYIRGRTHARFQLAHAGIWGVGATGAGGGGAGAGAGAGGGAAMRAWRGLRSTFLGTVRQPGLAGPTGTSASEGTGSGSGGGGASTAGGG